MNIGYVFLIFVVGTIPNAFAYTFENAELVVSDSDFVLALQHLIKTGIIRIDS